MGFTLVKGYVQSGKTQFILNQSIQNLEQNLSTFIIVRNIKGDLIQLANRFTKINVKIKKIDKNTTIPNEPTIFILLANYKQLKLASLLIQKGLKFSLIIDEIDYLDNIISKAQRQEFLSLIKQQATHIYGVSATILDTIFQEDVRIQDILFLQPCKDYKSITDITWKEIPELDKKEPHMETLFFDFVLQFSSWKPLPSQPLIYLVKITHLISEMYIIQNKLSQEYPNITTIVYNGKGLRIFRNGRFENCNGKSIADYLSFLRKSRGTVTHLLIISGELASRGINFVSSDLKWQLVGQYMRLSETMTQPELIQSLRLCGNKTHSDLRLYCTKRLWTDINKAFSLSEKLVSKSIATGKMSLIKDIITEIPVDKTELIKKRKITKNKKVEKILNITTVGSCNNKIHSLGKTCIPVIKHNDDLYNKIVKIIPKNKWITKVSACKLIEPKEYSKIVNIVFHWHNPNKNKDRTDENTINTLLFKFENNKWNVRFNEK